MSTEPRTREKPLKPSGKPMSALKALAAATAAEPMTEFDVYRACQAAAGRTSSQWAQASYHDALRTLVGRGLAAKCGSRGLGQWHITDKGREALR